MGSDTGSVYVSMDGWMALKSSGWMDGWMSFRALMVER